MKGGFFYWFGFCYEPYDYEMMNTKKDFAYSKSNKIIKNNVKLEQELYKQRSKKLKRAIQRI